MSDSEPGEYKHNNSTRSSGERSRSHTPRSKHSSPVKKRSYSRSRSRSGSYRSRSRSNRRSRSRSYRSRSGSPRRRSRSYDRRSRSRSGGRRRSRHGASRSRSRSPMSDRKRHVGDRMNPPEGRCLGIFGLSLYTTESDLREVFCRYGRIDKVNIVIDQKTGRSRGFGFVYYESYNDAADAKERANGMELDGRRIRVDFSITKRPHTPTPGVYVGRPTTHSYGGRGGRSGDRYSDRDRYGSRDYYRDDYRNRDYRRRSPSPYRRRSPSPYRDRSPYRGRY